MIAMRPLYCRSCGYDLSPMFAKGEESGTCPECGSLASTYFLKQRQWRRSVLRSAAWSGALVATVGSMLTLPVLAALDQSEPAILLLVVPTSTFVAIGVAAIGFRRHVRVRAATGEFWAFLASVALLSGVISVVIQTIVTMTVMALWIFGS